MLTCVRCAQVCSGGLGGHTVRCGHMWSHVVTCAQVWSHAQVCSGVWPSWWPPSALLSTRVCSSLRWRRTRWLSAPADPWRLKHKHRWDSHLRAWRLMKQKQVQILVLVWVFWHPVIIILSLIFIDDKSWWPCSHQVLVLVQLSLLGSSLLQTWHLWTRTSKHACHELQTEPEQNPPTHTPSTMTYWCRT